MKKLIAVLVVFALVTTAVFAQPYFGAWGRAVTVPFYYDGDAEEMFTGTHVGWAPVPNFAVYFSFSGEEIGFETNWCFSQELRDTALNTWWKPNDMFKLTLGWANDDRLRGADVVSSFHYLIGGMPDTNDAIFHCMTTARWWMAGWNGSAAAGAILAITPIDDLFIGISLPTGTGNPYAMTLEDTFKMGSYAVGYTIEDIGLVRAGYFGTASTGNEQVQFAFRLDAVQNLLFDIGFGYSLAAEQGTLALAAGYRMDAFNVNLGVVVPGLGGDVMGLNLLLNPAYDLDIGTVGAEILVKIANFDDVDVKFGAAAYFFKAVSGGSFKAGLALNAGGENIRFAVPIEITYSVW